ncbi:MAG: hypothetical protein Q9172_002227 [Xanthocarpia lactea]
MAMNGVILSKFMDDANIEAASTAFYVNNTGANNSTDVFLYSSYYYQHLNYYSPYQQTHHGRHLVTVTFNPPAPTPKLSWSPCGYGEFQSVKLLTLLPRVLQDQQDMEKDLDSRTHGKGHFQRLEWLEKEREFVGFMDSFHDNESIQDFDEHLITTLNNDINLLKEDNKQLTINNKRLTAAAKNLAGSYVGLTKLAERLDASFMALAGPAHEMVVIVRKVTKKGSPNRANIVKCWTDPKE